MTVAHGPVSGVSFAPDRSDRLVYGRDPGYSGPNSNLWIATADGRSVRQLTHGGWSAVPAWGRRGIAYNHAPGPHPATSINQVFLIRPDGSDRRQITRFTRNSLVYGLYPMQFSADGKHLLAAYPNRAGVQTWVIDIVNRRARRLMIAGQDVTPDAISRDGTALLVESNTAPPVMAVMDFNGGNPRILAVGGSASWNR